MRSDRTAPTAGKLSKVVSLFLAPLEKVVDHPNFGTGWIWQGEIIQKDGTKFLLAIEARFKLASRHGQIYDYAVSRLYANRKKAKQENLKLDDENTVSFNIVEFLKESNKDTSWNSKRNAMKTLSELRGFTVGIATNSAESSYPLVSEIITDSSTGKCTVAFNPRFDKLFEATGTRYVNIKKALELKGKTPEFLKFLQANGRTISKDGVARYVKTFTFAQAMQFLHCSPSSIKSGISQIERELRKVEFAVGVKYTQKARYLWEIVKE